MIRKRNKRGNGEITKAFLFENRQDRHYSVKKVMTSKGGMFPLSSLKLHCQKFPLLATTFRLYFKPLLGKTKALRPWGVP